MPSATACLVGFLGQLDDGMHALAEFRIGQADHDAGADLGMRIDRGLDFRRIDICTAAQIKSARRSAR